MRLSGLRRGLIRINLFAGCLLLSGCGEPQIKPSDETVTLMMRLNTAVMGEKPELLDKIQKDADTLQQSGGISQSVHERILEIITQGRDGNWKEAKDDCLSFLKGQKMK